MSEENTNPDLPEENPTPEAEDWALEPAPFSLDRISADSPLSGLVERAKTDPGLPFEAAILDALAELRREDLPAFEVLRTELKREAKIRVTALDRALPRDESEERHSQAQVLSDMAATTALFHDTDGNGFADLTIAGHRETWPIRSKGFRRWLARQFYEETGGAPTGEAMQAALNVAEARAIYDCPEYPVFNRVGGGGERLFLDLGDAAWRAVEITGEGWQVVEEPPVRFRRAAGVRELPEPETGGSIEDLRPFLNVGGHADFVLAVAWLLAALRPSGPYPVLALAGEQGSAKSTFTANLRALVDPNAAPLRALPREDRDLFIAAQNGHVLAFDNVSGLPAWISDTLCRLATGGGFAVRTLYSDADETLFDAMRPAILNGIEDAVTRPDLADRALFLTLQAIPEEARKPEAELRAAFEAARPRILGALLDGVAEGLRRLPDVRLARLPRMADFALWATACETAFWPAGTFESVFDAAREEAVASVIEADAVASAVRALAEARTQWTGTATNLLGALAEEAGEAATREKGWPKSARALSGRLRRAATFLRKLGVAMDFDRDGPGRTRIVHITFMARENGADFASRPSRPSAPVGNPAETMAWPDDFADGRRTQTAGADANATGPDASRLSTVRANQLELRDMNATDGMDAKPRSLSGGAENAAPGWQARL